MTIQKYFVTGIHCKACEILIEGKLSEFKEIVSADCNVKDETLIIKFKDNPLSVEKLNEIFKGCGYTLYLEKDNQTNNNISTYLEPIGIALLIVIIFFELNNLGLSGLVNVTSTSTLPAFFIFGLLAGVSTCAALTGGLILSMSQQWRELYSDNESITQRMQPHFLFNSGRLIAYLILGLLLGLLGSQLKTSITFGAVLVILVSLFMILNALKMLGIKKFDWLQISLPKSFTKNISNEKNFRGKLMPTILGALTFLLPCGFTITVESLALLSGSPLNGALMLFLFALGTILGLLLIGLSSVSLKSSKSAANFSRIAGILVLVFAIFNINSQFNVLGLASANSINIPTSATPTTAPASNLPPLINGKQVIEMEADFRGYRPNHFVVKAGIPVVWKINDTGTNGCTGALIAKSFFNDIIQLTPGKIYEKEFTPKTPGNFRFSCTMGMANGSIEVVN